MKSSTRDEAEGKLHQVKGKIKEIAGKVIMNPDLEAEGQDEILVGKAQEKIGQIEKESIFKSIAGSVLNPLEDAWKFIQSKECTVFYSGSVAQPEG